MIRLRDAAWLLSLVMASHGWAQDATGDARARIDAIRQQRTLELDADDAACLSKFAVTDCQSKVGTRRRQMLAELKRQEGVLNAAERRKKGLEQEQKSQDKAAESAQRELDAQADTEKTTEEERRRNLDGKAQNHRDQAKSAAGKTSGSKSGKSTSALDAATVEKNRTAYQDKLKELEKRRQERDKRLKDHGSGSAPLPLSP